MPPPFGMTPSDVEAGIANPGNSSNERSPLLGRTSEKGKGYATTTVTSTRSTSSESSATATETGNEDVVSLGPLNKKQRSVAVMLFLLLCGEFIAAADISVVSTTYPIIASSFSSLSLASWIITSYTLAACATQPISGKLSDIYSRKTVLMCAYTIFVLGTVLCGIATSFPFIIAARAVAGVGGAGMTVVTQILIGDFFGTGAENRGKQAQWRGIGNVVVTTGRAFGGPVGGFLSDTVGWRWGFTGQGPLIVLLFVTIAIFLIDPSVKPEDYGPVVGRGSVADSQRKMGKLGRIDFPGAFLITSSVILLVLCIDLPGQGVDWTDPAVYGTFCSAVFLLSLFLLYEKRYAKEPIYPPRLLKQRNIITSYLCLFFGVASQVSMLYTVPLYFQVTAGASAGSAGLRIVPAVLASSVGGLIAAAYIKRTRRYKNLVIFAAICTSVGNLLLILTWNEDSVGWGRTMAIVPNGFGTGIIFASSYIGMTARLKRSDMAVGTSGLLLFQNIGVVFGISTAASIINGSLRELLGRSLTWSDAETIMSGVLSDIKYLNGLDTDVMKIVVKAYVGGFERSHGFSLACSLLAFFVALCIPETRTT